MIFRYLLIVFLFFLVGETQSRPLIAEVVYTQVSTRKVPVQKKQQKVSRQKDKSSTKFHKKTGKKNPNTKGRWGWLALFGIGLLLFIGAILILILGLFPGPGQITFPILVLILALGPLHQALVLMPIGIIAWIRSNKKAKLYKEIYGKTMRGVKADFKKTAATEQASLSVKDQRLYVRYQLNITELLVEIKALESKAKKSKIITNRIHQKKLKIDVRKYELKILEASTS